MATPPEHNTKHSATAVNTDFRMINLTVHTNRSTTKDFSPAIPVHIRNQNTWALLDTGAVFSLVSNRLVTGLDVTPCSQVRLKGVNGQKIQHQGLVWLNITVGSSKLKYPFLTVTDDHCDLMLGWDFMKTTKAYFSKDREFLISPYFGSVEVRERIDPYLLTLWKDIIIEPLPETHDTTKTSSVQSKTNPYEEPIYATVRTIHANTSHAWYLRTTERLVVEPGHCKSVTIANIGLESSKAALITPSQRLLKRTGLTIPDILLTKDTEYVQIWNTSIHKRTLNKGTKLGCFDRYVEQEDILPFSRESSTPKDFHIYTAQTSLPEADYFQQYDQIFDVSSDVPESTKHDLFRLIHKYQDIFGWKGDEIGKVEKVVAHIDVGDAEAQVDKSFPRSAKENSIIAEKTRDLLNRGIIEPSSSEWSSYPFLVLETRGNGEKRYRMVLNYKKLNKVTRQLQYPMPKVESIVHTLRQKRYVSSLDMQNAYYQIKLDEASKPVTAFQSPIGHMQFKYLAFGLINSPAIFAKIVYHMLEPMKPELRDCVRFYVDDLFCYSNELDHHLKVLENMFEQIREYAFVISPKKCSFFAARLRVLGHTTDAQGTRVSERQISAITSLPAPRTLKQCRSILGSFNFFRKYLKSLSAIARPIEACLSIDPHRRRFIWTPEADKALQTLKEKIQHTPILCHFLPGTTPAILESDASTVGLGIGLYQVQNGILQPIGFASRALNRREQKYAPTTLELLAIIFALKRFRALIWLEEIICYTDHKSLVSMLRSSKDNELLPMQLQRMLLYLRGHNITLKYKAGKSLELVDTLSRFPEEPAPEEDDENLNIVELNTYQVQQDLSDPNSALTDDSLSTDQLYQAQLTCPETQKIFESVRLGQNKGKLKHCFIKHNVLLYHRRDLGKTVSFLPKELRLTVLEEAHDNRLSGHNGCYKTYRCLASRYFWPNMKKQIYYYVLSCHVCQLNKASHQKPGGLYEHTYVPCRPFSHIQCDVMGPMTRSTKGYRYIVTANCIFSKYLVMGPLRENSAEELAEFLLTKVFLVFGPCQEIKTDQGSNFRSRLTAELMKLLGVTHVFGSIGYAAGLAVTEKSHDFINNRIRAFANTEKRDWCRYLPFIAYSFNASISAGTQMSPFMALFGYDTLLPSEIAFGPHRYDFLNEVNNRFEVARDIAQQNLLVAQDRAEKALNQKRRPLTFNVGDLALVQRITRKKNISHKMLSVFEGPVKILEIGRSPVLYLVQYLGSKRKKWFTHVSKLKPYILRDITKLGLPSMTTAQVPTYESDVSTSEEECDDDDNEISRTKRKAIRIPSESGMPDLHSEEIPNLTLSTHKENFTQLPIPGNSGENSSHNFLSGFPHVNSHEEMRRNENNDDMPILTPYVNVSVPTQLSPPSISPLDTVNESTRAISLPTINLSQRTDLSPHLPIGSPPPTHGYFLRQRK